MSSQSEKYPVYLPSKEKMIWVESEDKVKRHALMESWTAYAEGKECARKEARQEKAELKRMSIMKKIRFLFDRSPW